MANVLLSLRGLESLSPAMSLQHHTGRGKLAEWHHGATHEYHVNVGSEPALGFTALTPTPSYFLHVRVSLFMCVWFFPPSSLLHVCVWCRMAGESRTTHFFMLPLLFIPPLLLSFCPSGFSEQPSDFLRLWWRRSDTLYIMPSAMLKALITLTLISLQQHQGELIHWTCWEYHQYMSLNAVIKKDNMLMMFFSLHLSCQCAARFHICCHVIYGNLATISAEENTSSKTDFFFLY